jgi:uncharacterized membrane protein YhdT
MTLSILLLTTSFVVLRRTNSGLLFLGENTILFVSDRYGASIHNKRSFFMVSRSRKSRSWLLWLLIIPFIALLIPQFYNYNTPTFIGIPFFYWYQLLWIIITAILTAVVYLLGA